MDSVWRVDRHFLIPSILLPFVTVLSLPVNKVGVLHQLDIVIFCRLRPLFSWAVLSLPSEKSTRCSLELAMCSDCSQNGTGSISGVSMAIYFLKMRAEGNFEVHLCLELEATILDTLRRHGLTPNLTLLSDRKFLCRRLLEQVGLDFDYKYGLRAIIFKKLIERAQRLLREANTWGAFVKMDNSPYLWDAVVLARHFGSRKATMAWISARREEAANPPQSPSDDSSGVKGMNDGGLETPQSSRLTRPKHILPTTHPKTPLRKLKSSHLSTPPRRNPVKFSLSSDSVATLRGRDMSTYGGQLRRSPLLGDSLRSLYNITHEDGDPFLPSTPIANPSIRTFSYFPPDRVPRSAYAPSWVTDQMGFDDLTPSRPRPTHVTSIAPSCPPSLERELSSLYSVANDFSSASMETPPYANTVVATTVLDNPARMDDVLFHMAPFSSQTIDSPPLDAADIHGPRLGNASGDDKYMRFADVNSMIPLTTLLPQSVIRETGSPSRTRKNVRFVLPNCRAPPALRN